MPLKLITLNVEGDLHLQTVLPFLESQNAEVVCLQEVFEVDMPLFEKVIGAKGVFVPMVNVSEPNKYGQGLRGKRGVAYFTTLEHAPVQAEYFKGDGSVPVFTHPYDNQHAFVFSSVLKDGVEYIIATTHFTWSPDGQLSSEQDRDFISLKKIIERFPDLVLCGDFNAPRGRQLFSWFEELLIDNLPAHYVTTLDTAKHRKGALELVVDTIFTRGKYTAKNVFLVDGVSDHMAVVGEVSVIG